MKILFRICLLISLSALTGCKLFTDMEMERLCKKDGGIKIYEQVKLPKEMFTKYGDPVFFKKGGKIGKAYKWIGNGYELVWKTQYITRGSPSLRKSKYTIVRLSDGRILGTYVTYLRRGGDVLPRLGPDSAKRCPNGIDDVHFVRKIFINRDKN